MKRDVIACRLIRSHGSLYSGVLHEPSLTTHICRNVNQHLHIHSTNTNSGYFPPGQFTLSFYYLDVRFIQRVTKNMSRLLIFGLYSQFGAKNTLQIFTSLLCVMCIHLPASFVTTKPHSSVFKKYTLIEFSIQVLFTIHFMMSKF